MTKYRVYGTVMGGKFLGEYEADTKEEAEEMAWENADVSLCHQCSCECDDPQVTEITTEEV